MIIFNKNLDITSEDVFKCLSKKTLKTWKLRVENDILSMDTQIEVMNINKAPEETVRSIRTAKVLQEMLLSQINKQLSLVKSPLEKFVEDIVESNYTEEEILEAIRKGRNENRK